MKEERIELAKRIHRHKTIFLFERKMKLLGLSNSIGVYTFLNIRLFISIILFLFVLIFYDFGVFLAPIITFLFYNGFSYVVFDGPIIKRKIHFSFNRKKVAPIVLALYKARLGAMRYCKTI